MVYVLDSVLAAALLFFLFLPITDRRTVAMKLGMMVALAAILSLSLSIPRGSDLAVQPAGMVLSSN
ncbi:MAG: hypothetical protein WA418_33445 [Bradyrhizobium sp.]